MSIGHLQKLLKDNVFVVTGECGPPRGSDAEVVRKKAKLLAGNIDAVNVTDNQTSIVRMSSVAASKIILDEGLEPVMQMVCRDRNRIAMQSDVLGAVALGIKNLLCLSGDHQVFGNQKGAKNVYDLDSIQLLFTMKKMRDEGVLLGGDKLEGGIEDLCLGAASNPFGDPFDFRVQRLAKKQAAGADFVQTQCIYNMDRFKTFMARANDEGLLEKIKVLAGITPLKSLPMAKYMAKKVSGIDLPKPILDRLKGVPKKERAQEGIKFCIEQIEELREIKGVAGIHLMAIEWEHKVEEIVDGAGLLPRPPIQA
jgi:methylenetetrahydrofolate reductase (NADPH)